ncbi:HDOD domain-containing protein [Allohahella sp. A8]|uniref:HDOD domain-containing protein n=1 Tax=Allohahella sp. A8 TaxID=3141461 RepID=UPI003A806B27
MAIPNAVEQVYSSLLDEVAPSANPLARPVSINPDNVRPEQRIRSQVLHDALGRIQVLMPVNALLDLEDLNQQLGRDLRAVSVSETDVLTSRFGWSSIPAIPAITRMPCVVEKSLMSQDQVVIDGEHDDSCIALDRSLFASMHKKSRVLSFGQPIESLRVNRNAPEKDVEQIVKAIQSLTSLRIEKRLQDTLELPPLPQTAQRIIQLRVDPNAGVNDLSDIVETDPALAAQVVSWARSSFYAAPGKISSVHDAIMRVLGYDLVMNLSIGLSLGSMLRVPRNVPEGFTPYWEQAVWTATLSGALADAIPRKARPDRGLCYLAGLLHNLGYLVLAHVFPPHFEQVNRICEANPHLDSELCEQHVLGVNREQIGSRLMYIWNMPDELVDALRQQKNVRPEDSPSQIAKVLFLATQLLRRQGIGQGPVVEIPDELFASLDLSRETADTVAETLFDMSDEIQSLASQLAPDV